MQKRYIVRLTDQERDELCKVVEKLKRTGEKVRRFRSYSRQTLMGRTCRTSK